MKSFFDNILTIKPSELIYNIAFVFYGPQIALPLLLFIVSVIAIWNYGDKGK